VEQLLTVRQVAEKLGMSPRWVMTELEEGRMPGFKMNDTPNGRWRLRASEVEREMERRRRGPEVAA
jgi:predicted site-specific integrase-resolvase